MSHTTGWKFNSSKAHRIFGPSVMPCPTCDVRGKEDDAAQQALGVGLLDSVRVKASPRWIGREAWGHKRYRATPLSGVVGGLRTSWRLGGARNSRAGGIALTVERLLCKQRVGGSNPSVSTGSKAVGRREQWIQPCRVACTARLWCR